MCTGTVGFPETEYAYMLRTWNSNSLCWTVTRPLGWPDYLSCKSSVFWLMLNMQTQRTEVLGCSSECWYSDDLVSKRCQALKPRAEFQKAHPEMERKSAGECFLLTVIFILHVFNAEDLYNMQTHLLCNTFNQKHPLPNSCDTPSPQEKLRQTVTQGSEKGLLRSFIYVIVPTRCPRSLHYAKRGRANRTKW